MPDNPHPLRDEQPDDLWLLDRLLAGEAHTGSSALTGLLASAASPASAHELMGEAAAVAAFIEVGSGVPSARSHPRARRVPMLTTLLASKIAAAAAAGGLLLAATAAAAQTGVLPTGLQDLAHHAFGAPAPSSTAGTPVTRPSPTPSGRPTPTVTATGPDAAGAAGFGLCTAHEHGGLASTSVAYRSLAKAAGGTSRIDAYCASVTHPGNGRTGHPTGGARSHRVGAPTGHPTQVPASHRTGAPTGHPTGARTSHPAYSTDQK